ncbi:putative membrane protein [Catenuloplanes atrovinosus]|uniref:Membrane protein n=2 Tax=Catenuloplanes atrovinosus TaxID=137266 RepID=A0AAE4CE26_9ACTN|nr:putative membrane protein [Catenuloplanes atrovinosus]
MGLFVTGLIFDAFHVMGGPSLLAMAGYWQVVGGLVAAAIAGLAGVVDLLFLRQGTRARRVAIAHGLINGGVLAMFAVIWLVRVGDPLRAAGSGLVAVELLVLVLGGVAAWLAGELVEDAPADGEVRPVTLRSRTVQAIGALVSAR